MSGGKRDGSEERVTPDDMVAEVKVISGRRITLPEKVCEDYNLHEGSSVTFVRQHSGWLLTQARVSAMTLVTSDGEKIKVPVPSRA